MADERYDTAFVVGAALGGVAGAVYALFSAPRAGARTRAELAGRWHDGAEQLAQSIAALDERLRQLTGGDLPVGTAGTIARPDRPAGPDMPDQFDRAATPSGSGDPTVTGTGPNAIVEEPRPPADPGSLPA